MNAKKIISWALMTMLVLSTLYVPFTKGTANTGIAYAQTSPYLSKTGGPLEFLLLQRERSVSLMGETQKIAISVRFDHELNETEIATLEDKGLLFVRVAGEVAHSGTIYGADMPFGLIEDLKERDDVLRIESAWLPGLHTPLDVSIPEINVDDVWQLTDAAGRRITGEGITIADFDTGIDVFHPDFWQADGGSYGWIDSNSNNIFDPGTDSVDLNASGNADVGETLDFFDGAGNAGNNDGVFQANRDWLFNDANGNGQRDYGTANGFAEGDPTFGERLFLVDDSNNNNTLNVGENVIALGTSKVRRTLNTGGVDRVRGTDLILTANDTNGHGTSVCGILDGGIIGRRLYVGVAPDAELLVADRINNDYTVYMPWARNNGADVMLYEFGGWVQEFLDGSSNLEQAIDAEAAGGIMQVVPAGNLAGNNKHAQNNVPGGGSTNFTFNVPATDNPATPADEDIDWVWITVLWRTTANNLSFRLTTPTPSVVNLPATPPAGWQNLATGDGHTVFYRREDSTSGTAKYDITINRNDVIQGGWTLRVNNGGGANEHVDVYIADNQTSWSGGAVWTAFQSDENTVTFPATADSAITVASYSTRGWGVAAGALSTFSGRGPRIDGQLIVDVAAPGNFDVASAASKDAGLPLGAYHWFSGTSAAGPHVAATGALMLQKYPALNHNQIQTMLQIAARHDAFTGITPNDDWGYGKLDALASVSPIVFGLQWLRNQQNANGSWTYSGRVSEENVGLTSIATIGFLNYGINESDPVVERAINWILSKQQGDGKITNGQYHTYDASLAILALVATRNNAYYDEIQSAANFLMDLQNDEGEGYSQTDKYYGGWPYWQGQGNWADLSNSQFAMLALWYAEYSDPDDTIVPVDVWNKVDTFVTRCQNREASNPDYNFYDDGGFIYMPESTEWAGGNSYASITAAGLWGFFTAGIDAEDGRVQEAWGWIQNNYYVNQNYPMGNLFLYYYLYGLAKAGVLWGVDDIGGHNWYQEMTGVLVNNQGTDGHWPGTDAQEEPDNVATSWALLAFESKIVAPGTGLHIDIRSPADLHLYDPEGRHVGINYDTGEVEIEIPGATYSGAGTEPQVIDVPEPMVGRYRIELVGKETGDFTLTIEGTLEPRIIYSRSFEGRIQEGQILPLEFTVSALAGPITIDILVRPPTANANGPYEGYEGKIITLDASGSSDPDNNIVSYEWDLDNDGDYDDATGVTIDIVFGDNGIYTVGLKVTDLCGESDTDTTEVTVLNVPPEVTVDIDSQNVQYSDYICDVTFTATDVAADTMTATTSPDPLPESLVLTDKGCSVNGGIKTCTWSLEGIMDEAVSTNDVTVTVTDDDGGAGSANTSIIVLPEDADIWLDSDNLIAVKVDAPGGDSPAFSLTAYVQETDDPDNAACNAAPGDINNAEVEMTLAAVGPGDSYTVMCTPVGVIGNGYDAILEVKCDFDNVKVNTYHVQATVVGGYYASGPTEDVLVVYDPSLGFVTGGGWFYWPGTTDKTNFGFTTKYKKKGQNVKGNLLFIRHLPDGSFYMMESNALYGMALGEDPNISLGWASFSGKCTYLDPGWLEPEGNYEFLVYVEDNNEPGNGFDRFWIEMKDKDREIIPEISMDRKATENAVELQGGNIAVPH